MTNQCRSRKTEWPLPCGRGDAESVDTATGTACPGSGRAAGNAALGGGADFGLRILSFIRHGVFRHSSLAVGVAAALAAPTAAAVPPVDLAVPGSAVQCYTDTRRFNDLRPAAGGREVYAASRGGVLVFNAEGARIRTYTRADGLCHHNVREVLPAPDGAVWFATAGGVARLDQGTWRAWTVRDGLLHAIVHAVGMDKAGRLYAGTQRGTCVLDGDRFVALREPHEFARRATRAIHAASDGSMWFAKANALTRLLADGRWETFQRDPLQKGGRGELVSNNILSVTTDFDGRPWVGTKLGLGFFDGAAWRHFYYRERFFDGNGLLDNRIVTVAMGAGETLWLAYGDSRDFDRPLGVTCRHGDTWRHWTTTDGLPSDRVYRIRTADAGRGVWLATAEGGLVLRTDAPVRFRGEAALPVNCVTSIERLGSGRMAVQTTRGVVAFQNGMAVSATDSERSLRSALPDEQASGVRRAVCVPGLPGDVVSRVTRSDAAGNLWVGTREHGLLCHRDGQWFRLVLNGLPLPLEITSLCFEGEHVLWVGTVAEGAMRIDCSIGPP